jgi:hypothetical protein
MTTMRPINPNPTEFQIQQNHMELHPSRDGYWVLWNGPVLLDVGLPFGGSARFTLASFPNATWVDLQDQKGQPIPLSIYVDRGIIMGKWA